MSCIISFCFLKIKNAINANTKFNNSFEKWAKKIPIILIVIIGIIDKSQINNLAAANIEPIITKTVEDGAILVRDYGTGVFDANNFKEV